MSQVSGGARRTGRGRRRARPGVASFRSPLTALAVALSLIVQLFAIPYHQARSAPLFASPDTAAIAAELKATFGDAATLCVEAGGKGAPLAPAGCCDDQCPFCRFSAQAAALIAPDAPALPLRLDGLAQTLGVAPAPGSVPAPPTSRNRARAPPLAV
jgi:hypothetical protein